MLLLSAPKPPIALLAAPNKRSRQRIIHGDILDFCHDWRGPRFHGVICDAPYHLTSITDRFGDEDSAPAQYGKDGAFGRLSGGFMGKHWDGGNIAFRKETWRGIYNLLLPGGFLMAFGGSRTFHRMAVAIEDAGFVIHPTICWLFGSGFPKATRIDTAIDKAAGAEQAVVGLAQRTGKQSGTYGTYRGNHELTAPATEQAQSWAGHRYGLQALKPAAEFIVVAQKPYDQRSVDSIVSSGAGAINVNEGRIPGVPEVTRFDPAKHSHDGWRMNLTGAEVAAANQTNGRWPANLVLTHSVNCTVTACAPDCAVSRLGQQSGERVAGSPVKGTEPSRPAKNVYGRHERVAWQAHDDEGTAARFFHNSDWHHEVQEQLANADPFFYCAKADQRERNAGLDNMPAVIVNDGRQTSIDNPYQRGDTLRRNTHPTVKPIDLCKHLATLLLPPTEYGPRRLLVPFSGSGSEMIGAFLAGWEVIVGVEMEWEYCQIARKRLDYYANPLRSMVVKPEAPIASLGQLSLFSE